MTGQTGGNPDKVAQTILFIRDADGWVDSVTDVIIMPDPAFYDMFTPLTDIPS